jgi:dTDP-4-amino-4,6-dideoxygalactose transaminase
MFVTRNPEVYEKALIFHDAGIGFREHAKDLKTPIFAGMNLRGNEILAAVVRVQLGRLDGIIHDLHRINQKINEGVKGAKGVQAIPRNGGDKTGTGASLAYHFPTEATARAFSKAYEEDGRRADSEAEVLIDWGRHVYMNWEVLMSKRGAHHPDQDPFRHPKNAATVPHYHKDMLPKTLDILRRTVKIGVNPNWTDKEVEGVAGAIRDAAASAVAKETAAVR